MTWKTVLSFIASATLLILLGGRLIRANVLPIQSEILYSKAEQNFVQIWIQIAIAVGLFLPLLAFFVGIRHSTVRTVFGFYLLVLMIQIATEQFCSHIFSRSLSVLIGTLYTVFRLWQLWRGRRILKINSQGEQLTQSLLWLLLLFWSANLIFLFVVGWSRTLSR